MPVVFENHWMDNCIFYSDCIFQYVVRSNANALLRKEGGEKKKSM